MSSPLVLRLLPGRPLTRDALAKRLQAIHGARHVGGLAPRFTLSSRERRFVRGLHAVKENIWLWRCRQDAFAGDFIAVDMSAPSPDDRRVWVLELKQGAPIKSTSGHQMARVPGVLAQLAQRTGVVPAHAPWEPLTGDGGALLALLSNGLRTSLD